MFKPTRGPWAATSREGDDWDSVVYVPGTPKEICQCFHGRGHEDECEANARLIAAAPEMLHLLRQARRRWLDAARAQEYWTPQEKDDLRRIDSTIAKATGGAQ